MLSLLLVKKLLKVGFPLSILLKYLEKYPYKSMDVFGKFPKINKPFLPNSRELGRQIFFYNSIPRQYLGLYCWTWHSKSHEHAKEAMFSFYELVFL